MGLTLKSIERCFILICCLFILGGCASKAQPPFPPAAPGIAEGSIITANGGPADMDRFIKLAIASDYILIGEAHSSACDHMMQARFISALAGAMANISTDTSTNSSAGGQGLFPIGLEMISQDIQPQLDAVNAGDVPLTSFAETVNWPDTWGYDFDLYRPVFEAAYAHALPLFGLNVPRNIVKKVSRGGVESLTSEERKRWIPENIIQPSDAQRDSLMEMLEAHRSMMGSIVEKGKSGQPDNTSESKDQESSAEQSVNGDNTSGKQTKEDGDNGMTGRMDRFFLVQSLWDTAMAERAVEIRKQYGSPVVVLAGSGHVEFGWGLAHRLTTLDNGARVLLVTPWRAMEDPDPLEADLRFYCPVTHKSRMGFTLTMAGNGAKVLSVMPESRAAEAGFIAGDILLTIMDTPVDSMWVMHKAAVKASKQGIPLRFGVLREGAELTLSMPMVNDDASMDQERAGDGKADKAGKAENAKHPE